MAVTEKDFRELIALTAQNSQAIKDMTEYIGRIEQTVERNSSHITWLYRFGIGVLFTSLSSVGGTFIMNKLNEKHEQEENKSKTERVVENKTMSATIMYNR